MICVKPSIKAWKLAQPAYSKKQAGNRVNGWRIQMDKQGMNQVKVLFFGRLADFVSDRETTVSFGDEMSAENLYRQLLNENPSLPSRETDSNIKVAVNQVLVDWSSLINNGDEVAFLPPVTGG